MHRDSIFIHSINSSLYPYLSASYILSLSPLTYKKCIWLNNFDPFQYFLHESIVYIFQLIVLNLTPYSYVIYIIM